MAHNETVGEKERHWCLTVFLTVIIISSFYNFFIGNSDEYKSFWRRADYGWLVLLLSCLSLVNFISAIGIFRWKKWGFWLFAVSACLHILINCYFWDRVYHQLYTLMFAVSLDFRGVIMWFECIFGWLYSSIGGFIGIVSLYKLLHIGGDKKAWTQLE